MTLSQIHTCGEKNQAAEAHTLRPGKDRGGLRGVSSRSSGRALTCTPAERLVGIEDSGEKAKRESTNTE